MNQNEYSDSRSRDPRDRAHRKRMRNSARYFKIHYRVVTATMLTLAILGFRYLHQHPASRNPIAWEDAPGIFLLMFISAWLMEHYFRDRTLEYIQRQLDHAERIWTIDPENPGLVSRLPLAGWWPWYNSGDLVIIDGTTYRVDTRFWFGFSRGWCYVLNSKHGSPMYADHIGRSVRQ